MNQKLYLSVFLVALIIGLMAALQFRTTNFIEQGVPLGRSQELSVDLNQLNAEKKQLETEVKDLTQKIQQTTKGQASGRQDAYPTLAKEVLVGELKKARLGAGLTAVSGPGIEITLDNPSAEQNKGLEDTMFAIRDEDLLHLVNELNGAGAEAVSINGQRILATSEIRWAAPFINVNLTRIAPPYHILTIGSPKNLTSALEISGGLAEYLQSLGAKVKIQPYENLTVPGYTAPIEFRYAKPTKGE
jgi:uncharacterized protein YlxW (UPF0749 family)